MTPPDTSREIMSRAALDPRQSVVVEACAGSGKTWLLVSRILRLLLAGAPPSSILAITFTRKAAHEMKQRLTQYLETLATASPDAARRFLRERYMADADIEAILPRLPGLPAAVAFASPGLNIATFHGWYQQLLTAAPLGMGSGDATIADSEYTLLQEAWLLLAEELSHQPASPAAQALDRLYAEKGLTNTQKILFTFIARRAEWLAYAKNLAGDSDPVAAALAQMAADWGLQPDSDPLAEWHTNPAHHEALQQLIRGLAGVPKLTEPMNKWLLQLEAAIIETSPEERHTTLTTLCLTQKGEMRQHPKNWADKAGQAETFTHLCVGLLRVAQTQRDQETWRYNRDALIAANALLATYEKLKTHQRVLDFTDLEWRAYQLITDSEHADTVQYRLDNRYRHILLDEFQDTNPIQWQCLVAWLDASRSAHDGADQTPTVFMVGDPKQAIYRFRRTDARLFDQARDYFIKHFNASAYSLNHAWRNAPAVLNFINPLFAAQPAFTGFVPHQAERQSWGGVCVLPPFEGKATAAAIEVPAETQAAAAWRNPLTQAREEEDSDRFEAEAAHMAQTIQQMVGRLIIDAPDSTQPRDLPRPARYGDILVLFRARTHLAAFENALKRAGIPYTGARPGGL
ncbi:MAG: UvrD-helicase domain-containing protein, partial [Betaproteobacteria bacterium]|nr:UvrD-helicase domain-containing protein [Betaproteobacteria bacterium]